MTCRFDSDVASRVACATSDVHPCLVFPRASLQSPCTVLLQINVSALGYNDHSKGILFNFMYEDSIASVNKVLGSACTGVEHWQSNNCAIGLTKQFSFAFQNTLLTDPAGFGSQEELPSHQW